MNAPRRQSRAFTLLELLVVLAIFGLFAAMAYGGLNHVLTTRKNIEATLERVAGWQKAFQKLRNDFQLMATRPSRNGIGTASPAFVYDEYASKVSFTHAGWRNPLFAPRASVERVSVRYDAREHELVRESYGAMDVVRDDQVRKLVLLREVSEVRWRFMDQNHQLVSQWPNTGAITQPPPLAVELTITGKEFAQVRWLFRVGALPVPKVVGSTPPGTTPPGTTPPGTNPPPPTPPPITPPNQ